MRPKVELDIPNGIGYVRIRPGTVSHTRALTDSVIADFDAADNILGLELLAFELQMKAPVVSSGT